ncbi:MAG: FAD-binding oxidoreductase [Chloroflexota bacterium]
MIQQSISELKNQIAGEVVLPDSPEYNDLRNGFSATGNPAVIVRPQSSKDVAAAIGYARNNQLKLSVRSGGHSQSGMSTNDGGMVIDLGHFNTVEVIDPAQNRVRIGTGAKWGDAAEVLAAQGLAISSGDTKSVGVGGLTLGGGIGWLVRKVGLTIDSLEAAEIVTADGRTLHVSAQENPDLFWAIRGGGGNFGVVTSFDFRAQPLKSVFAGMAIYDIAEAESALTKWAEAMRHAPEELNSTAVLFSGFGPQAPAQLMILVCYGGDDEAAANQAIQPLLELGTLKQQTIQAKPYYQALEEAAFPPGIKAVAENGFIKTLNKEVIAALAAHYGKPGTAIVQIRSLGGAVARIKPDATAFAHRDYEAFVMAAVLMPQDVPQEQAKQKGAEAWRPLEPFVSGAYANFLTDASELSVTAAYPDSTYARLAQVKAQYDPDNLFNQNHNIKPQ